MPCGADTRPRRIESTHPDRTQRCGTWKPRWSRVSSISGTGNRVKLRTAKKRKRIAFLFCYFTVFIAHARVVVLSVPSRRERKDARESTAATMVAKTGTNCLAGPIFGGWKGLTRFPVPLILDTRTGHPRLVSPCAPRLCIMFLPNTQYCNTLVICTEDSCKMARPYYYEERHTRA